MACVTALTLLVTAETMAMARGASPAVSETILCTSHGIERIHLDAEGAPTSAPHICPECLLFFGALAETAPNIAAPIATKPIKAVAPTLTDHVDRQISPNRARAPPVVF